MITFEQWKGISSKSIDFTTWMQEDIIELYFERMDSEMFNEVV